MCPLKGTEVRCAKHILLVGTCTFVYKMYSLRNESKIKLSFRIKKTIIRTGFFFSFTLFLVVIKYSDSIKNRLGFFFIVIGLKN